VIFYFLWKTSGFLISVRILSPVPYSDEQKFLIYPAWKANIGYQSMVTYFLDYF